MKIPPLGYNGNVKKKKKKNIYQGNEDKEVTNEYDKCKKI